MQVSTKRAILFILAVCLAQTTQSIVQQSSNSVTANPKGYLHHLKGEGKPCPESTWIDLVKPHGYPVESYEVTTEDGYILKLFRLQKKGTQIQDLDKVVMMQHGIFDSGDTFFLNNEDGALGFVLANEGYDVWVSNSRGSKYSLKHTNPKITKREYWDYSFVEMGIYDTPANIKFILEKTGKDKLTYIGHSQGTTQMYAALTDPKSRDYVNSHVKKFIALAPVVFLENIGSSLLKTLAEDVSGYLIKFVESLGLESLFGGPCTQTSAEAELQHLLCKFEPKFCDALLSVADVNPDYDNLDRMPFIVEHFPGGSSVKSLWHYKQFAQLKKQTPVFQKFDYGRKENLIKYSTPKPPAYDFKEIKIPVSAHVGFQDNIGDMKDNENMKAHLTAAGVDLRFYIYDQCGHATFLWAKDPTKIFTDVLKELGE